MSVKRAFFGIFQKLTLFCCAMFFGITHAFSANLPSGYTELEYIQSTGTQYIDTGFSPDANTRVDWKGQLISGSSGVLLGARVGNSNPGRFFPFAFSTGTNYRTTYGAHDVNVSADTSTVCTGSFRPSESKSIINGTTYSFVSPDFSKTESNNLLLFGVSGYGDQHYLSTGKIWYVKIWDNNTLVRNLVPAKNSSGVVGMYDTVNNRFYTNQGTGTFTAGPLIGIRIATTAYNNAQFNPVVTDLNTTIATIRDVVTNTINQTKAIADLQAKKQTRPDEQCPAGKKCLLVEDNNGVPHWYEIIENIYGLPTGYTPLEYIRSSGVAYIDTGYSPTSKTRIELVAKMDSGAGNVNIVGSAISTSSGSSSDALLVINSFSDTEYEIKFGPSGTWPKGATNMTTKNTFSLSATEFRVNNVVKETYSGSVSDTGNKPFYLFQRWRPEITSTDSKVQIYEFNIYENGTLVRRMVPAKQGTTVGMYDTIGNRFYTKSGTGSLTAGPEI